jgi:hypothetical protein
MIADGFGSASKCCLSQVPAKKRSGVNYLAVPIPLQAGQLSIPYPLHFRHSGALKPGSCKSASLPVPLQSGHCIDP